MNVVPEAPSHDARRPAARRLLLVTCVLFPGAGSAALGDGLYETAATTTSLDREGRVTIRTSLDAAIISGTSEFRASGLRVEIAPGFAGGRRTDVDFARVQLMRLSTLRLLGVERDRERGSQLGLELAGLDLPHAIAGSSGSRDWAIARAGLGVGYAIHSRHFNAARSGHGLASEARLRVDEQLMPTDRVQLRLFQQVVHQARGGLAGEARGRLDQRLNLSAGLGVCWDVGRGAPFRRVTRIDPVTGKAFGRTAQNPGPRWRLLVGVEGFLSPIDGITEQPGGVAVRAGAEYGY